MLKHGLLFFLIFVALPSLAQVSVDGKAYQEVRSLKPELLQYNPSYNTYLPYLEGKPSASNAAVLQLNAQQYRAYNLVLKAQPQTAVLLNNRIVDYLPDTLARLYSIDSLSRLYSDSSILSLYHPQLDLSKVDLLLVSRQPYSQQSLEQSRRSGNFLQVFMRDGRDFENFFIVAALLLLAGFAALRSVYPKVFSSYYNLERAFAVRVRDEPNFQMKLSGRGHLAYLLHYSLLFSFLLLVVVRYQQVIPEELQFVVQAGFGQLVVRWLTLAGVVLLFQFLKYVLLKLVAGVFNLRGFGNVHFFDFMRISLFFYTLLFSVVLVLYWGVNAGELTAAGLLLKLALGFAFLRVLIIYLKLMQAVPYRKTYLFSYLCATEIIPLLIGLRLLL